MQIRSRAFVASAAAGLVLALCACGMALAQTAGKSRVVLMSGRLFEGVVKELSDGYEVTDSHGVVHKFKKAEVRSVTALDVAADVKSTSGKQTGTPVDPKKGKPEADTDDDLKKAIDIDENFDDIETTDDASPPLPLNESSVEEMKRIAGRDAQLLDKPHFALVYTSSTALAAKLASRLEAIYRLNVSYMKLLGVPFKRPEYKLEIFFFGTFKEYEGYASLQGFDPQNALGFYMQTNNRSAFFDMNTSPGAVQRRESLKNADFHTRRAIGNRMTNYLNYLNLTVIQHEAAHHIQFNMGVFNRRGDLTRWVVEGLAQMFELPPGDSGGSFGSVNHFRLNEFRQLYGKDAKRLGDLRLFIVDDRQWRGGQSYSLGWALHQYLLKKQKDKYGKFMQKIAQREDSVSFGDAPDEKRDQMVQTELQKEFEDFFGTVDEKWVQRFMDYMNSLQLKQSVLPD